MMTNKEMYELAVAKGGEMLVKDLAREAKTKEPNFTAGVTRYVLENKLEMPELTFELEKGFGRRMKRSPNSDIRISPLRLGTFNMKSVTQFELTGTPNAQGVFEKLELIPVLPDGQTMDEYLMRLGEHPSQAEATTSPGIRAALDREKAGVDKAKSPAAKGGRGKATNKKALAAVK